MTPQQVEKKRDDELTRADSVQQRRLQQRLAAHRRERAHAANEGPPAKADAPILADGLREPAPAAPTEVASAGTHAPSPQPASRSAQHKGQARGSNVPSDQKPRKKVALPSAADEIFRYPYATHRHPPLTEEEEKQELVQFGGTPPAREYSTGFILGIAIIVVSLITGIVLVRLHHRVKTLERRLDGVENLVATPSSSSAPSSWASR